MDTWEEVKYWVWNEFKLEIDEYAPYPYKLSHFEHGYLGHFPHYGMAALVANDIYEKDMAKIYGEPHCKTMLVY